MFGVAVLAAIFSANGDYTTPAAYVGGAAAGHRGRRRRRRVRGARRPVHPGTGRCPGAGHPGARTARGRAAGGGRARLTTRAVRRQGTRPDRSRTLPACPPSSATSRAADGTDLLVRHWPIDEAEAGGAWAGPPWASVLLVHGLAEHSGRYEHVGDQLTGAGLEVDGLRPPRRWAGRAAGAATSSTGAQLHDDLAERLAVVRRGAGGRPVVLYGALARWPDRRRLPPVRPAEAGPGGARRRRRSIRRCRAGRSGWPASCRARRADPAIPNDIDGSTLSRDPTVAREGRRRPAVRRRSRRPVSVPRRCASRPGSGARRRRRASGSRPSSCTARTTASSRPRPPRSSTARRCVERRTYPGLRHELAQRARGSGDHRRGRRVASRQTTTGAPVGRADPCDAGSMRAVQTPIG